MTLFKQVALAVSLIIIIMLGSVMYINYESAKQNLLEGVYETTVNNISSLSNKLADSENEEAYIVTIIDSEFDGGYYKSIKYSSNSSDFMYEQSDNEAIVDVPAWFVKFADVRVDKVTTDVSSGWEMMGELSIRGDTNIIYTTLYKMFINLVYLFVISVSVALIILSVLLHFVLKPLKAIESQAEAILHNEFVIQEKEPYTQEFKEVVKGMNAMVRKVETLFHNANESAKHNHELLYNDPVTKLFNRRYFMLKVSDIVQLENRMNGGICIFMTLRSVEVIIKAIGEQKTQKLLQEFASVLQSVSVDFDDKLVARMNERDFTMLLSNCNATDARKIINEINKHFTELLLKNKINASDEELHFGIYRYSSQVKIAELLTKTDSALVNAIALEDNNCYIYEDKDDKNALRKDEWHEIIENAIAKSHFKLKFWTTLNTKTKSVDHKLMTFTITSNDTEYYFGDFIAPAINFNLVGEIFNSVIKELLSKKYDTLNGNMCSIRLSNEFLKQTNSLDKLSELFSENAKTLNFKLFFEVSDSFVIKNEQLVKSFINLFEKYGFGFAINSFTGESNDFKYLQNLNPMYIKADSLFLLDQSKESMNALQTIVDSLDIELVATYVKTEEEKEALLSRNVILIQGPATDLA